MSTTSQEVDQKQAVTALRRKDLLGIAELSPQEIELVLDGRLRSGPTSDKTVGYAGIVFKRLEGDLDGRQKLASIAKIVAELSREEVRRVRRGA